MVTSKISHQDRQQLQVEERFKLNPSSLTKKIVTNDGFPDVVSGMGGIGSLISIDYSASPKEVIKEVGDALVPLISAGLSLIPGVGPIIGGVLTAVWSIFSPLIFGQKENPLMLMIKDIRKDMDDIKKHINELAKKIPEQMRKEMDDKMVSIIDRTVHGELSRNRYVCGKYSMVSKVFSDTLRANKTFSETQRIEMISLMHNCDNFLKDTAEAFVYPEYVTILWIPSAIATFMRVSFLTEVANYGYALKVDQPLIHLFLFELKNELKRHSEYYIRAVEARESGYYIVSNEFYIDKNPFNEYENQGCKIQHELLYLDRERYPHGVPQYLQIYGESGFLNLTDFNVTVNNESRHIQVFYNEVNKLFFNPSLLGQTLRNCFWGPAIMEAVDIRIKGFELSFDVKYVTNRTYEIRVVYFVPQFSDVIPKGHPIEENEFSVYPESNKSATLDFRNKKVTVYEESNNTLNITIENGLPSNDSAKRFVLKTAFRAVDCNTDFGRTEYGGEVCRDQGKFFSGEFVVESVASFQVLSEKDSKGKIKISTPVFYDQLYFAFILGAEIVVLPVAA